MITKRHTKMPYEKAGIDTPYSMKTRKTNQRQPRPPVERPQILRPQPIQPQTMTITKRPPHHPKPDLEGRRESETETPAQPATSLTTVPIAHLRLLTPKGTTDKTRELPPLPPRPQRLHPRLPLQTQQSTTTNQKEKENVKTYFGTTPPSVNPSKPNSEKNFLNYWTRISPRTTPSTK